MSRERPTLRTLDELASSGLIEGRDLASLEAVAARYAIAITEPLSDLIDRNAPDDPIARQFVPDARELVVHTHERADPIGDHDKSPVKGVVHRYPDRALLKISSVCPVYCRFCFRREMVGPALGEALTADDTATAIAYIRAQPAIWEVILTGGDPLVLSPRRIAAITAALSAIPHVKVLRWHTRVPVAEPDRVSDQLVSALRSRDCAVFVGLHTNHARELTTSAQAAIARLIDAGIPLVSQTVLLKGINDDADTLEALFRALVALRVKPYYLHHGDLAPGTSHFRTTLERGKELMAELRRRLSGLALPTYMLDMPGAYGKVPVESHVHADADRPGQHTIIDRHGGTHRYQDCCTPPDLEPGAPDP